MAFQILNLSVDHDHIIFNSHSPARSVYDDIDSFAEYLVETIAGDNNYTYEDHKEDGSPQTKGLDKYQYSFWFHEQIVKSAIPLITAADFQFYADRNINNGLSKGYFNIVSPPPKA